MGISDAARAAGRKKRKKKKKRKHEAPPKDVASPDRVKQRTTDVTVRRDHHNLDPDLVEDAEEFARIYDRIKKLEARKKALAAALIERMPEGGLQGKFVPLDDGRKVTIYKSKGQPKVGKKRLVESFGKKGQQFWDEADRAPDYTGVTVKD